MRSRERPVAEPGGAAEPGATVGGAPTAPGAGGDGAPLSPPDECGAPSSSATLVHGGISTVVRQVALPAVGSNLLMSLFASVDAFWVGTRVGAQGLAAVSTSLFWIWMVVALAEMVGIGLTAVAARRHGEGRGGGGGAHRG